MADEKKSNVDVSALQGHTDYDVGTVEPLKQLDRKAEVEVFGATGDGKVDFRTVGWMRATVFIIKQTFTTGVLSMPSAMYYLGGVASPLFIVFWGVVNTYSGIIQGHFKLAHPGMHTIIDGAEISILQLSGSKWCAKVAKVLTEIIYLFSWLLCIGLAVLAIGTALNAITKHGACTVVFNVVALILCTAAGSIRKIHGLGILLWIGFVSALVSVLMVVIAVAMRSRPAYAPQTGPYDLGFQPGPPPGTTFAQAWAGVAAINASSSNTVGYIPVMSEMKRPQDYFRSLYVAVTFVNAAYLAPITPTVRL